LGIAARALAGLARAQLGTDPERAALDIRSLDGLPADEVVDRIIEEFCPPGVLDYELARLAMLEALVTALEGADKFDLAGLTKEAVTVAIRVLIAELVFVSVASESGRAFNATKDPLTAVKREQALRLLIREVIDVEATPMLAGSPPVTTNGMRSLLGQLLDVVLKEIEGWE
jgi:hypothetical protein